MKTREFIDVLVKLVNKEMGALKIIYENFFQKIYKTAFSVLKNSDNAYDIAMNVIMKLTEYPSNPYLIDNHIGLLISMTKNESIDFLRRESCHINCEFMNDYAVSSTETDNLWLEDILNVLTESETEIFLEHCVWGKKLKDIANEREIPYITVKRRYAGIKNKVNELYK